MRFRTLALGLTAVGLLAVGTATPSPAAEIKKYEGTVLAPAPVVSGVAAEDFCPNGGAANGTTFRFFDLKGEFNHFFVSGPKSNLNLADPTGANGTFNDYDLDLVAFDAKCNLLKLEGSINKANGIGSASVAGKKPARYAAVSYFSGPPNLKVLLEASNEKIAKK